MDAERSASIHPAAQNRPVFVVLVKPGRLLIRQSAPHTPESTSSTRGRSVIGWALFGLLVSVALMGAKWFAYALTGSSAILSDAMESGVNILTSAFVLFAVWLAEQPRDDEHPYGHGRVEYFSAAFEGALIAFAALSIGAVALWRALDPQPLERLELGMLVQGVVSVASFAAGQLLIARGRALRSPSIQADGEHIRADGVTTVGTLIGVLMVWWTGWLWLDALVAGLVALWLGWCGYRVVRSSIGGLMDEADPELLERVAATLQRAREPGWLSPHHTKIMQLGQAVHIDLHMVFPAYWSIQVVHDASKRLERALREEFGPRTEVMLHMESCTPQSCSYCAVEECPIRRHDFLAERPWDAQQIVERHRAPSFEPEEQDAP